jgi:nucleotide-binding universal stress UspA family protein
LGASRLSAGALGADKVSEEALQHYQQAARQHATKDMLALLGSDDLKSGDVPAVILHGDPTLRIIEQEQERDCDLIVIGKQGETVTEEFLLGSVTKHILQQSQADVLVSA